VTQKIQNHGVKFDDEKIDANCRRFYLKMDEKSSNRINWDQFKDFEFLQSKP